MHIPISNVYLLLLHYVISVYAAEVHACISMPLYVIHCRVERLHMS